MPKKLSKKLTLTFREKVFKVVSKIPKGKVLSYKQVAIRVGSPKAFRAVGNILNKNPYKSVPCHRVIKSDGRVGGYALGTKKKIAILQKEGVEIDSFFKNKKVVSDAFFS